MEKILEMLREELSNTDSFDATILLVTGERFTGIIEGTADGVVSIRRKCGGDDYADIPRHYAISAVIGAYYTEGS